MKGHNLLIIFDVHLFGGSSTSCVYVGSARCMLWGDLLRTLLVTCCTSSLSSGQFGGPHQNMPGFHPGGMPPFGQGPPMVPSYQAGPPRPLMGIRPPVMSQGGRYWQCCTVNRFGDYSFLLTLCCVYRRSPSLPHTRNCWNCFTLREGFFFFAGEVNWGT